MKGSIDKNSISKRKYNNVQEIGDIDEENEKIENNVINQIKTIQVNYRIRKLFLYVIATDHGDFNFWK